VEGEDGEQDREGEGEGEGEDEQEEVSGEVGDDRDFVLPCLSRD